MSKRIAWQTASLVATLLLFVFPGAASAIPNQALNPHSDAAADFSYIQDNTKKPDLTNHFHLPLRDGESISVASDLDNYGLRSNKGWVAHHVWDNNINRFEDTPDSNTDGRNALLDKFAHGYIHSAHPVLYEFEENVPNPARPLLAEAFANWDAAAKAQSAGKQSGGGKPLDTSIKFKEAAANQASQFYFRFSDSFQGARNAYAEWIVSDDRVALGGGVATKSSMVFTTNPSNFVRAPQGVTLKTAGTLVSSNTFSKSVGWSFDKTPDPIEVDLQYVKDGQTFESLPGEKLTTNALTQIDAADKILFYQMDFFTIALHEMGHVLGLQHPGDTSDNIMRPNIEYQASWNAKLHTIDADSAYGAALLYSIPVPEPGIGAALLALAVASLPGRRPQQR
jgi:hypothetical protein